VCCSWNSPPSPPPPHSPNPCAFLVPVLVVLRWRCCVSAHAGYADDANAEYAEYADDEYAAYADMENAECADGDVVLGPPPPPPIQLPLPARVHWYSYGIAASLPMQSMPTPQMPSVPSMPTKIMPRIPIWNERNKRTRLFFINKYVSNEINK
jgi:hypothetical protein